MTRTTTVFTCDICKLETTDQKRINKQYRLPIIFHSETTEGRPEKPHVEYETVDVCHDCLMKSINIHAIGAQGNNEYWFGGVGDG